MGRIGWGAKAVIYALIGGLACDNAVGNDDNSASPQACLPSSAHLSGLNSSVVIPRVYLLSKQIYISSAKQIVRGSKFLDILMLSP